MPAEKIARVAGIIAETWRAKSRLADLPAGCQPANRAEAYAIQDELARQLGFEVAGWKFGATAPASMRSMKVDEPVPGRIFRTRVAVSPARVAASDFQTPFMEPEFAVRLDVAFPPQDKPYTRSDVEPHAALFLAIEIADYRIAQTAPPEPMKMIADNGGGAGWVLGPAVADWHAVDFRTAPARLVIDGKVAAEGLAGDGRVDPIEVAVWAVNHLSRRGVGLAAGAYLSTGSATVPVPMGGGTECVADFGPLGEVRVTLLR